MPPGMKGYKEILVVVDYMTRFTWAFLVKKPGTSASSATTIEELALQSTHCNELIEWENGMLLNILAKLCAPDKPPPTASVDTELSKPWPLLISNTLCILNDQSTPVLSTTPCKLMFGLIDDSFNINDLIELDADIGLHFAFLDSHQDEVLDTICDSQTKHK
ncbi:hypothetical protein M422DRAFT_247272 [Sphaerobolus stellatus SS14]|nr:hypothetical protein M422DRAFT_247272 [Sphaerobolus stellatus SS14]